MILQPKPGDSVTKNRDSATKSDSATKKRDSATKKSDSETKDDSETKAETKDTWKQASAMHFFSFRCIVLSVRKVTSAKCGKSNMDSNKNRRTPKTTSI